VWPDSLFITTVNVNPFASLSGGRESRAQVNLYCSYNTNRTHNCVCMTVRMSDSNITNINPFASLSGGRESRARRAALAGPQPRGQARNGASLAAAGSTRLSVRESQGYAVHGMSGKGRVRCEL